ncbi:hypothetical protein WMO41_06710 [Ventrimonas sp. CLA-AP-H27]|uniref:Uncharacterized protein n=1 Tax=Ventrimonas faecis TaxID=3133170 RepID=A0ABV1HLL9_9FIRM
MKEQKLPVGMDGFEKIRRFLMDSIFPEIKPFASSIWGSIRSFFFHLKMLRDPASSMRSTR